MGLDIQLLPIQGTNNKYLAGSDGHIYCYSNARNQSRKPSPFRLKEGIGSNGYAFVSFIIDSKRTSMIVHSVICNYFHGSKPQKGYVVRHLDGNKLNNIPNNLLWGTYSDNEADKRKHGRTAMGEKQGSVKLTDEAVRIIRASIPCGLWNSKDASQVFGVHHSTIESIARGEGWSHIVGKEWIPIRKRRDNSFQLVNKEVK